MSLFSYITCHIIQQLGHAVLGDGGKCFRCSITPSYVSCCLQVSTEALDSGFNEIR